MIDNVLFFVSDVDGSPRLRLCLPDHLTNVMIKGFHDFGNMGLDKTYDISRYAISFQTCLRGSMNMFLSVLLVKNVT